MVSPGFISITLTPCTNLLKSAGRPVSTGNVAEVHGDDGIGLQQIAGVCGLARAHGVVIADGQHGDVRRVEFANDGHVSEDVGIAGVINLDAVIKLDDVTAGFAAVDDLSPS